MTCPETTTIGAYVLGALDVSERRTTDEHLGTCADCREALLQFAHLPGLLHGVPLEDIQPPKRRRWLLAAATVAIVATGILGWQTLDGPASTTWTATNGVDGIDTTAKLTSHGWGTDIELRLSDMKPGEHCMLIVHARNGTVETAGWWATPTSYKADVPASTSIALNNIDRLEVVTADDSVLSTVTASSR